MSASLMLAARGFQKKISGHVSKNVLLTSLLPLSFASFFGTVVVAAALFPAGYDWQMRVISDLTSPLKNPQGYWLPSLGIIVAMLLALPFAGYLASRLRAATPRIARSAGWAFALSFVTLIFAVLVQLLQSVIGLPWLHGVLAAISPGMFFIGMLHCCGSALKDRSRRLGGQELLPSRLVIYWSAFTGVPLVGVIGIGGLCLMGEQVGLAWAEELRQSFRHTPVWQLAFWEWMALAGVFPFLAGSVLLLPVSAAPTGISRAENQPCPDL